MFLSFVCSGDFALQVCLYGKKCHVHEEFSTPQLLNKYLLIISNWLSSPHRPLTGTHESIGNCKSCCVYVEGKGGDAAVKNKNGRLSLNTMTSFLSLTARIAQAGKEEKDIVHLTLIREDANLKGGGSETTRSNTHVSKATTLRPSSNLDV